jgi:hypothetical protein
MGRTACTEPQCLYKGALYLYLSSVGLDLVKKIKRTCRCQLSDSICSAGDQLGRDHTGSVLSHHVIRVSVFEGSLATTHRHYTVRTKISVLLVAAGQNCTEFVQLNADVGVRTEGETRKALHK